jgi:hypothetical protein
MCIEPGIVLLGAGVYGSCKVYRGMLADRLYNAVPQRAAVQFLPYNAQLCALSCRQ